MEGPVVQDSGEGIAARALGELAGHALDVGGDTAVERTSRLRLAVAVENAPEDEELGGDLRRGQAETFALTGMVVRELAGILVAVEGGDEGGERAELPEPTEMLERGDDAVGERLLDALDREVPSGCPSRPRSRRPDVQTRFG